MWGKYIYFIVSSPNCDVIILPKMKNLKIFRHFQWWKLDEIRFCIQQTKPKPNKPFIHSSTFNFVAMLTFLLIYLFIYLSAGFLSIFIEEMENTGSAQVSINLVHFVLFFPNLLQFYPLFSSIEFLMACGNRLISPKLLAGQELDAVLILKVYKSKAL